VPYFSIYLHQQNVSGGCYAHHQELKLAAIMVGMELLSTPTMTAAGSSKV
jgi:hypothetical protein